MNRTTTIFGKLMRIGLAIALAATCIPIAILSAPQIAEASANLPTRIVNGDFEYGKEVLFRDTDKDGDTIGEANWAYINTENKAGWQFWRPDKQSRNVYWNTYNHGTSTPISGYPSKDYPLSDADNIAGWHNMPSSFDASKYGWRSLDMGGLVDGQGSTSGMYGSRKAWLYDNSTDIKLDESGNVYGDITPNGNAYGIYQDIATTPGTVLKWKLDHTVISNGWNSAGTADGEMQVRIGNNKDANLFKNGEHNMGKDRVYDESNLVPQQAIRASTNGSSDTLGAVGTNIKTRLPGSDANIKLWSRTGTWEAYTGTYVVPAGQTITRFNLHPFKQPVTIEYGDLLEQGYGMSGHFVDNVSLAAAYPLLYDLNGGTGSGFITTTAQAQANNYSGYYGEGTSCALVQSKPIRSGYAFLGWSKLKYGDITSKAAFDSMKGSLTTSVTIAPGTNKVYAVWGKNPTVSFYDGIGNLIKDQVVVFGTAPSTPPDPARKGYIFDSWDKSIGATYENTSITARWRAIEYDIVFDANGGKGDMPAQHMVYDKDVRLSKNIFTSSDSTWQRWTTKPDGSGSLYGDEESVRNLSDVNGAKVKLYARWATDATISFDDGWGTILKTEVVSPGKSAIPPEAPQKTGYVFDGWTGGYEHANEDATVFARWHPVTYSIAFDSNGGEGDMDIEQMEYGKSKDLSTCLFKKEGHLFAGWNTDESGTGESFTDGQWIKDLTIEDGSEIRLYAQWTPQRYSITFNANGGIGKMGDQPGISGEELVLPACILTKPGDVFQGWATSKDGPIVFKDGESVRIAPDEGESHITLYAIWEENAPVLIKYDPGDPDRIDIDNVCEEVRPRSGIAKGSKAIAKTGYKFLEWKDPQGSITCTTPTITPERDAAGLYNATTYTVESAPIEYVIRYDPNGGVGQAKQTQCEYGVPTNLPSEGFTREGYEFLGWSETRSGMVGCYEPKDQIANLSERDGDAVTLYARWKAIEEPDTLPIPDDMAPEQPPDSDTDSATGVDTIPDNPTDPDDLKNGTSSSESEGQDNKPDKDAIQPAQFDVSLDDFGDATIETGYGQPAAIVGSPAHAGKAYDKTGDASQTAAMLIPLLAAICAFEMYTGMSARRREGAYGERRR